MQDYFQSYNPLRAEWEELLAEFDETYESYHHKIEARTAAMHTFGSGFIEGVDAPKEKTIYQDTL